MRNRLAERREQLGLTKTETAKRVGTSKQHYGRLESGETSLDPFWLKKLAIALKCRPVDLLPELGEGAATASLVGYVGAGEIVFGLDDGASEQLDAPPGIGETHVVRVRGDVMWPSYTAGDLLFFSPSDVMDRAKCLYRDCVVQVLDGATYVKRIIPGSEPNLFILASSRAPEIMGVQVQWASSVLWVKRG